MNENSSTDLSASSNSSGDAISRRAYELWEQEGRPEGCHVRHWLQAEQELSSGKSDNGIRSENAVPPNTGTDVRPLEGTRAAAAANRPPKRGTNTPFGGEKNPVGNGQANAAARRKPTNAPAL